MKSSYKSPKRQISDSNLEPFYYGVDEFCKKYLPDIDNTIDDEFSTAKVLSDPIERYISLYPWEVAIVDTLLFQRLRSIRQLGLAFLVYPTLSYSRFEHTIGVLGRLKQILTSLQENLSEDKKKEELAYLSDVDNVYIIRLAALCHDIGHCFFSHVSEDVIQELPGNNGYPSSKYIIDCYKKHYGRSVPFSEILSSCIVLSPFFIDYLSKVRIPGISTFPQATKFAEKIANLILGLPTPNDPKSLFLSQLMNSGFDVDKLDYMLRESLFSGISLGISLEWLLKKITIKNLPANQVPEGLLGRIKNYEHGSYFYVLALKKGGQFAFEEFCIARLALHEKIYLHQKIRAAEAQLKSNLRRFINDVPAYKEAHRWLYLKESLKDHPNEKIIPELPEPNLFDDQGNATTKVLGLDYITERKLMYRAFAFGWHNDIAKPMTSEKKHESGTDILMKIINENPQAFENQIEKNYNDIIHRLEEENTTSKLDILIDPPKMSTIQQGQNTLFIECPSRLSLRWTMPIDKLTDYYHRNRALAYIFTTKTQLSYVLLAAEKAVWDLYGVLYEQEGFVNSQAYTRAQTLKQKLHELGYYSDALELQPISDFLNSVFAQKIIANIAQELATYESRTKRKVTPTSITAYLSQFPVNLQEAALEWLKYIEFIRPEQLLYNTIKKVLEEEFQIYKTIAICPVGSMSDSATRIAYDLRNIESTLNKRINIIPLVEALGYPCDCYILYDDNLNTGLQAINIMASWLGCNLPEEIKLNEEHVQELPEELKRELKTKPLSIHFALATEGGCKNLKKKLIEIFNFSEEKLLCKTGKELHKCNKVFSGESSAFQHSNKLELRDFLKDVGSSILQNEGKTKEKADEKSLGYSSAEAMVVFPYNCPTMTVTPLWITGKYKGRNWMPLIERGRRTSPMTSELIGEDS
jgi:HD superfamily phosphohydrolase